MMSIRVGTRGVMRGQSLVETLVFAMALLPLLLGLVLVTKYQSVRQSSIAAVSAARSLLR